MGTVIVLLILVLIISAIIKSMVKRRTLVDVPVVAGHAADAVTAPPLQTRSK